MVCNDMLQQDASGEVVAAARKLSGSGGSSQDFLYSPPLPSAKWRDVGRPAGEGECSTGRSRNSGSARAIGGIVRSSGS